MNRAQVVQRARIMRALRRYLINGLLIWVPVLVTVLVVRFILQLMDQTLLVLPRALRPDALLGLHVPGLGAVLGLLIVLLTGLLVTNFIGRTLVAIGEELLERIPFVRALYSGVKSFSETVLSNSGNSFKKVLLVEYPRAGAWSIGFQTTDHLPEINARLGEPQVCVFIPTTPNPTSGFIIFVPQSKCIELDMHVDAAMKMIVTLGVVGPSSSSAAAAAAQAGTAPAAASSRAVR
ncbi:MAG TPA: DUF502 domain-containing protein [Steroidobacteraceae bacterium]|nr:DUF502 domain-containing protein [Steroidobacteraceae bacterium]